MKMRAKVLIGVVAVVLSACVGGGTWKTDYRDIVDRDVAKSWRISSIDVDVPRTLSVSEENSFAPDADIVWHEDAYGDRYDQVDRIITQAARIGSRGLQGSRPVHLVITVSSFHAVTPKTRYRLQDSGVHNISFSAQLFDVTTGQALTEVDRIRADLPAYTGRDAILAEARGETQKRRIIAHVSNVIAGWLGTGPDVRGSFSRSGR